jgi:hypothetical protein
MNKFTNRADRQIGPKRVGNAPSHFFRMEGRTAIATSADNRRKCFGGRGYVQGKCFDPAGKKFNSRLVAPTATTMQCDRNTNAIGRGWHRFFEQE